MQKRSKYTLQYVPIQLDADFPLEHIITLRIQMATTLLRETTLSILEVSQAVGYDSLSSFNRHFKQHLDLAPREWRMGKKNK